jgi:hypothetical protein
MHNVTCNFGQPPLRDWNGYLQKSPREAAINSHPHDSEIWARLSFKTANRPITLFLEGHGIIRRHRYAYNQAIDVARRPGLVKCWQSIPAASRQFRLIALGAYESAPCGVLRIELLKYSYNKSGVLSRGNQASGFTSNPALDKFLSNAGDAKNEWTYIIAAGQHEAFRCWLRLQNRDIWCLLVYSYSSLVAQLTSLRTMDQVSNCNKFGYELWIQDLQ